MATTMDIKACKEQINKLDKLIAVLQSELRAERFRIDSVKKRLALQWADQEIEKRKNKELREEFAEIRITVNELTAHVFN